MGVMQPIQMAMAGVGKVAQEMQLACFARIALYAYACPSLRSGRLATVAVRG